MDNVTRLKLGNTVSMKVINNKDYPINGTIKIEISMKNGQPDEVKLTNISAKTTKKKEA